MPGEASRQNGKKGGRPRGSKNVASLERDKVAAALRQRILQSADRLFNAQMSLAEGCAFLFKRGAAGGKATLVTDEATLRRYVDGELDPEEFVYLHTERPNIVAIQDAFNRALGKPTETVEVSGKDGEPVRVVFGGRHKPQEGK
jgi:hypothetical protein